LRSGDNPVSHTSGVFFRFFDPALLLLSKLSSLGRPLAAAVDATDAASRLSLCLIKSRINANSLFIHELCSSWRLVNCAFLSSLNLSNASTIFATVPDDMVITVLVLHCTARRHGGTGTGAVRF
jgi:hypothetical protein